MEVLHQPSSSYYPEGIPSGTIVAIDASRNRSGGAKGHLMGILNAADPRIHGIAAVHVWSYDELLSSLPDRPWLTKHAAPELKKSLLRQLWWQYRKLPQAIRRNGCNVLLSTHASTTCRFTPAIVMSRDMLCFEGNEMRRYGIFSFARMRLFVLKYAQVSSLRRATAVLFLTHYAADVIQGFTGKLKYLRVIPHGVGENFRKPVASEPLDKSPRHVRCLYVSNTDMYKHQWHVVRAIAILRKAGHSVSLKLVGGGLGPAKALLDKAIDEEDPSGEFVEVLDAVRHSEIPLELEKSDIFIFASSCENMPNTLVEAMAGGLPIACSNRGPMPEILQGAGTYFNPEDPTSISRAVEALILDGSFRRTLAQKGKEISDQYSWERCAHETWNFLVQVAGGGESPT
jgi:glycosyltransferase involved in cell wall biosynthesis